MSVLLAADDLLNAHVGYTRGLGDRAEGLAVPVRLADRVLPFGVELPAPHRQPFDRGEWVGHLAAAERFRARLAEYGEQLAQHLTALQGDASTPLKEMTR